jgi:RimJ/RimL family protein N-acetyltransferase
MSQASRSDAGIVLTALADDDAPLLHAWRGDPAVRDGALGYPFPTSLDAMRAWIRSFEPKATPGDLCFAVRPEADAPLIGYAQLRGIDWVAHCAEVGVVIGDRAWRGSGHGRAILRATADYAFDVLAMRRLWLRVAEDNAAAVGLYTSFGFAPEGRLRRHAFRNGRLVDVLLFGLERETPG